MGSECGDYQQNKIIINIEIHYEYIIINIEICSMYIIMNIDTHSSVLVESILYNCDWDFITKVRLLTFSSNIHCLFSQFTDFKMLECL